MDSTTFAVDSSTKVVYGTQARKLSDIKVGANVQVDANFGRTPPLATQIDLR